MILSKDNLKYIDAPGLVKPNPEIFTLPEKVLQFGTGVLLRGLCDYYIDKANRQGIFNGRIVVVKSTGNGAADDFAKQQGLYTLYSKGIVNAEEVEETVICSSISRVLSAANDWAAILNVAKSPDLQVIISNTTEVGIQLVNEDVKNQPPVSFPGKLLAVLYERFKAFKGDVNSGLVIVPTELIVDNGKKLEAIVLELAHLNNLEHGFMDWLENCNTFCNSLVDRIVPGKPDSEVAAKLNQTLGYADDLLIISEIYSLWAIEGDEKAAAVLSFSEADEGIVITPEIELFRELKLRLLNGSHTISCAFAIISGFATVKDAMNDNDFQKFISQLVFKEIIPSIPYIIEPQIATDFARKVLDRYRNPHVRHEWLSIAVQYSAKMKMRVLPLLLNHYKQNNTVPVHIAIGFAAFIRFMKIKQNTEGAYTGAIAHSVYVVTDSNAVHFASAWENADPDDAVNSILSNKALWDTDLTVLPGFQKAVTSNLKKLMAGNVVEIMTGPQ